MAKKTLPVAHPPIVCFLHHAYPLSIIFTHKETLPWFYSNYIQLFYYIEDDYFHLNFFTPHIYPHLKLYILDIDLFSNVIKRDIIQFLIDCISNDIYIYTFLDDYYVPGRKAYKKYHNKHDNFIFGYNLEEQYFDIAGFVDFNYSTSTIGFDELKMAFLSPSQPDAINLYKYKDKNSIYEFDKGLVADYIYDYLFANDTSRRLKIINNPLDYKHLVWGVRIYEGMSQYIDMLLQKKVEMNIVPFHILYEHKKCMRMRIEYMIENEYLDEIDEIRDFYLSFEEDTLSLRNLVLKAILGDTETAYKRIKERFHLVLKEMVPKEEAVLKLLLQRLTQE